MGVLLKWKKPDAEASYDTVRIYRSDSESGSYTLIASQTIQDNSYYDGNGVGYMWYKIDFFNSVTAVASDLSSAIQGGVYFGYCTVDDIRTVTNIKPSQISDTQLANLIEFAAAQLNSDINVYHEDEVVSYIDETKSNEVDGTNLKFFTKHYPIGDMNNDFRVNTSDIRVFQVDSQGNKSELGLSQINAETGEFRLNDAPTSDKKLYLKYFSTQRLVDPTDALVKMACILLTAAWGYSKLNIGKADRFRMGSMTVFRDTDAYHEYYMKYMKMVTAINDRSMVASEELGLTHGEEAYLLSLGVAGVSKLR